MTVTSLGNILIGKLFDSYGFSSAWLFVAVVGSMAIMLILLLNVFDRASFPLLYKKADK